MIKKLLSSMSSKALVKLIARLKADEGGNIMIIMGFALVPLTFAVGFGVDYARAMSLQTQLNAAADSAALAAVAPATIFLSNEESKSAATKMFNAQAARLDGYQDLVMTPVVVDGTSGSGGSLGFLRKATISYTVKSINMFGGILGSTTLTVTGTASASAQQPPNVDFYLAMDNSPSMLLPASSDGVSKIIAATKSTKLPNGCAFACHMQMPHADNDPIYIRDLQSRDVLLSTGYYRWDSSAKQLYDSAGNPMNNTTTTIGSPTTISTTVGPTTSTSTSGKPKVTTTTTTTTVTNKATTVTTKNSVTYSIPIPDSTTGPVIITQTTVSTPTTQTSTTITTTVVTQVGNANPTTSVSVSGPTVAPPSVGTSTSSSVTYDTGYWADGYWLTHNYGKIYGTPSSITLRKDEVVSAATQLIPFAAKQAAQYRVTYQAQMFSFDWTRSGGSSPVRKLNDLKDVKDGTAYGNGFSVAALFPADDYWWLNAKPTSTTDIADKATEFNNMLTTMNGIIPTAGTGAPLQTPQKILFIISDGMLDQPNGSGRYFGPIQDLTQCTAIKAKSIKIAILYTQYLPESLVGNGWSQTNIAPFLPAPPSPYVATNAGTSDKVLTALQSCASPGTNGSPLVQTVTADDDITTALQQLFSTALQTARLVQ